MKKTEYVQNLLTQFNNSYLEDIRNNKKFCEDSVRNKPRIEIPSAFAISLLRDEKTKDAVKLLDLIIAKQKEQGYWAEYSYEKDEEPVGYYGAVPTCFCIFALLEGYKKTKNDKYLYATIKACDYLYSKEKSGYFFKAQQNKSDVINTNLMCALALMDTISAMSKKSKRANAFRGASVRAIRRSLSSQKLNGAFPYTSYGLTVPFLYHSMSLALLANLSFYFRDSLLSYSIKKGIKYLNKISNPAGSIQWKKEKFSDKSGSCWVYGWNYNLFSSLNFEKEKRNAVHILERLKAKRYLKEGDNGNEEDLFNTAWTILSISLCRESNALGGGFLRFYVNKLYKISKLLFLIIKIINRKLFSFGLDKGPVEYW